MRNGMIMSFFSSAICDNYVLLSQVMSSISHSASLTGNASSNSRMNISIMSILDKKNRSKRQQASSLAEIRIPFMNLPCHTRTGSLCIIFSRFSEIEYLSRILFSN